MPQQILIAIAIITAFLPALFWLFIWYKKDSVQPEPKRMIVLAFFFGVLGILPFFGIKFMLKQSPTLLELWGDLSTHSFFLSTLFLTILLAGLEEFVKHFSVLRLGKYLDVYFDQIVDGVVYSVSAALGFAFAENIVYFVNILLFTGISPDFWSVFLFRSFGTMVGHTIFSGIFGYFWAYAFFSKKIATRHSESVSHLWNFTKSFFETIRFHIIRRHILIGRPSAHRHEKADLLREAFLLATLLHTIFNLLLGMEIFGKMLTPLIVPLLIGGFVWISGKFLMKENVKIMKPI
jgi:RsiW-degrading membrane proteinase PrsW (M82 family)